jgi:hypothetical protein
MASHQRGDYTGKETERLQREHRDELLERSGRIGLVNELPVDQVDGLFDPFSGAAVDANGAKEEIEQGPIQYVGLGGGNGYKVMRVNTDVDDMTYGVGNTFSLKRGTRYRVAQDLYDWLASKGLVIQ